jgi:hypothetical protein
MTITNDRIKSPMQIDYRSFVYLGKVEVDAIRIYMGIELWEHTLVNDKFLSLRY